MRGGFDIEDDDDCDGCIFTTHGFIELCAEGDLEARPAGARPGPHHQEFRV